MQNYRRAIYQGGICLVHPSSSAPCRFLYVVYLLHYHWITTTLSLQPVRTPPEGPRRIPHDSPVHCVRQEYRRQRSTSGALSPRDKPVAATSSTSLNPVLPQHSQGYPVQRKGRRHSQAITVPKHHLPTGIGHWGQAELETDATRQRTSGQERPTFGVHLHYIIGCLCLELDISPCLALD
ncbi:hypothetical protein QBC45DRAFT_200285 [Copromyces sp. CBS 386.78]|nr:hypothetical protein QBC45DRAFT_200285 [Copromyces sp. CBS 386.78]